MITLYSKNNCPYCKQAKNLLTLKGVAFEEIKIDEVEGSGDFLKGEGHRTVPQIYKDGKLLVEGGYHGLSKQTEDFWTTIKG